MKIYREICEKNLFENGIAYYATMSAAEGNILFQSETKHVRNVSPKRYKDFSTGRWCARQAMTRLGIAHKPICAGTMREPIWPEGITGSISHTTNYYCAAISKEKRSIGVDAQTLDETLTLDEFTLILTHNEISSIKEQCKKNYYEGLTIAFSCKESIFKSLYPITKQFFDFKDVFIRLDFNKFLFTAILLTNLSSEFGVGIELTGQFWFFNNLVVSMITID